MPEVKKSRKSRSAKAGGSNRALRAFFTIIPLPLALSLLLFPDLGSFSLIPILGVFAFGLDVGTVINIYWIQTLVRERAFYKEFYETQVMKPLNNDPKMLKRHAMIQLPFYAMGIMMLIIVVFVFGILNLDFNYALPFILGAMEGVPVSYYLLSRGLKR